MAEDFKDIVTAMEELLRSNVHLSVSECSVWSEESGAKSFKDIFFCRF
jgi:hypothetical protein